MLKSFRLFMHENEMAAADQWYFKVPLPAKVGNFVSATQSVVKSKMQSGDMAESRGDVFPGRQFPLPTAASDFAGVMPNNNLAGQALMWILEEGLYEALYKRQRFAERAAAEMRNILGNDAYRQAFGADGLKEDAVYSPKVMQAVPAYAEWFQNNYNPEDLEPTSPMLLDVGDRYIRVSPKEVNEFIGKLNQEYNELGVQLQPLSFSGPKGLIEHIEDGPWAQKERLGSTMNPSHLTKHGVDLSGLEAADQYGRKLMKAGGLMSSIRQRGGSFERGLRELTRKILNHSSKALAGQAKDLSPEDQQRVQQLAKGLASGQLKPLSVSGAEWPDEQGLPIKQNIDYDDTDKDKFAVMAALVRAGIDRKHLAHKETEQMGGAGANQDALKKSLEDKLGQFHKRSEFNPSPISFGQYAERDKLWKNYGVGVGENPFANKNSARITGAKQGNADFPSYANNLVKFGIMFVNHKVKQLLNNLPEPTEEDRLKAVQQVMAPYAQDYIQAGLISPQDLATGVHDALTHSSTVDRPSVPMNYSKHGGMGKWIDPAEHGDVVSQKEIDKLLGQGFSWNFTNSKDLANKKATEPSTFGELVNQETGKKFAVSRMQDGNWKIVDLADMNKGSTFGDKNDRSTYAIGDKGDPRMASFGIGGGKVKTSPHLTKKVAATAAVGGMRDYDSNPQKYGYGFDDFLGRDALSALRGYAAGLQSRAKSDPTKSYDKVFLGDQTPDTLAPRLLAAMGNIPEAHRQFGDPQRDPSWFSRLTQYLASEKPSMPHIEDPKLAQAWAKKVAGILANGKDPVPVKGTDMNPEAYQGEQVPEQVLNAVRVSAARWRHTQAASVLRKDLGGELGTRGSLHGTGGDGEETEMDVTTDKAGPGVGQAVRGNGDELAAKFGRSQVERPDKDNTLRGNTIDLNKHFGGSGEAPQIKIQSDVNFAMQSRPQEISSYNGYRGVYERTQEESASSNAEELGSKLRRALLQAKETGGEISVKNFRGLANIDGIIDYAFDKLKGLAANYNARPTPIPLGQMKLLVKNVMLPLSNPAFGQIVGFNASEGLKKVLGGHFDSVTKAAQDMVAQERGQYASAPQQPTAAANPAPQPQVQKPAAQTAAPSPAPTGPTLQATPVQPGAPKASPLDRFRRKPTTESFRDVAERRLKEMAATGAIYDGSKPTTFNWEGSVGLPGGKSIDGEVEDRQSNPDGTKPKRKRKCKS